jgi:hypothetical protein
MTIKPYNQKHKTMTKRKEFNIERVKEFCRLVNEGKTPNEALREMNSSNGYTTPLRTAGIYWKDKDGTFKALCKIRVERYNTFIEIKNEYNQHVYDRFQRKNNRSSESYKKYVKQATLFNQPKEPKPKTTTPVPTMKAKQPQLNFIQRVVKSLFKL